MEIIFKYNYASENSSNVHPPGQSLGIIIICKKKKTTNKQTNWKMLHDMFKLPLVRTNELFKRPMIRTNEMFKSPLVRTNELFIYALYDTDKRDVQTPHDTDKRDVQTLHGTQKKFSVSSDRVVDLSSYYVFLSR